MPIQEQATTERVINSSRERDGKQRNLLQPYNTAMLHSVESRLTDHAYIDCSAQTSRMFCANFGISYAV